MPTTQQLRTRLANKLKELFQLDQPDLDFGFYRIMHAKAEQVTTFIENDLLKIVADAFGHLEVQNSQGLLTQAKQRVIDTLGEDAFDAEGNLATNYRNSPIGKNYLAELAKLEQSKSALSAEADIYDHLYRFFERYYDAGDFISRRYYARETAGKAAPFAIPYNGEEVKLHWANADQYYIKTTEYFANFTFDLRQAKEVNDLRLPLSYGEDEQPRKVHFRIVDATEGEHGNVKAAESTKRFFLIYADNPVDRTATGELVINFEYRPDPTKTGPEDTWREKRNAEAVDVVLSKLAALAQADNTLADYLRLLKLPAPTEKDSKRPLLAKYINQYTARNTMDYFIHKDLGGFLRRELDFYIKNEVMRLDDIEHAEAPAVETYLAKIKVLRKIAGKLIDFLTQLEEFQKKLWLKKKFVVETNYCITLDRVPEELYPEIADNDAQREEWVNLFAIDEIKVSTIGPGYSVPLSVEFLKANDKLVLDTKFLDESFKAKLISTIENFEDQCDGLLIHSENFQALNMLQERYREQVKTTYIDPPYNTSASEIAYKNSYKHSSWLSLVNNSILPAKKLFEPATGVICCTIDDFEHKVFSQIIEEHFGELAGTVAIRIKPSGRPIPNGFAISHEYAIFAKTNSTFPISRLKHSDEQKSRYKEIDSKGQFFWEMFRKAGSNSNRENRPTMFYPFYLNEKTQELRIPEMEFDNLKQIYLIKEAPLDDEVEIYPIKDDGSEGNWYFGLERALTVLDEFRAVSQENESYRIYYRRRPNDGVQPTTLWFESKYSATEHGTALLKAIFGQQETFSYPKSIYAVEDCLSVTGVSDFLKCTVLDYFAGSGTTGHAVIEFNRQDDGQRKYIL